MTLYEIDRSGWVYRQVQLFSEGTRFAPEDILMCQPVNVNAMAGHPATEEICSDEFELLWGELVPERAFHRRLPDADASWHGKLEHRGETYQLQWSPTGHAPRDWARVPGFRSLFVLGDDKAARAACVAVFIDQPILWSAMALAA